MQLNTKHKTINVNGLALVITALIVDNAIANLCRLAALKYVTKSKEEEES